MRFLTILFLTVLLGCATVPPKPSCDYEERSTYIAEVPYGDETYYCLNAEGMSQFIADYVALRKCYTDLDAWSIKVDKGKK